METTLKIAGVFAAFVFCANAPAAFAQYNPLPQEKREELLQQQDETQSPLAKKISALLERQDLLYAQKDLDAIELQRRAGAILADYALLIRDHPKDLFLLLHYAKFLRDVGDDRAAMAAFLQAIKLNPETAVAYQQLAAIQAEKGAYVEAFENFKYAVKLAPEFAVYHYQLGEFVHIFRDLLVADKLLNAQGATEICLKSFKEAAELEPENKSFAWRYAQYFFEADAPDWREAARAWEKMAALTQDPLQSDEIRVRRAYCALQNGQLEEAAAFLKAAVAPAFEKTKGELLAAIAEAKKAQEPAAASAAEKEGGGEK